MSWPVSRLPADRIITLIDTPPFRPVNGSSFRRTGTGRMLEWLADMPGDSWQERWKNSRAESLPKEQWLRLPMRWRAANGLSVTASQPETYQTGLLTLVVADVIRPALAWMVRKASPGIVALMTTCRDPDGYAQLRSLIAADPVGISAGQARLALGRITMILASSGGTVAEITVGDFVDLLDAMRETGTGGAGRLLAYRLLREAGNLGADAPASARAFFQAAGQRTVEELVDRYQVHCRPVRDLFIDYLRERQPALDYNTLNKLSYDLVKLFWTDLERHRPGIESIQLTPQVAAAWRDRVSVRTVAGGRQAGAEVPRADARSVMTTVRAFYLDLAQWALDDPAHWAQWAVPCPIKENDCLRAKDEQLVKARMDRRTRERLPRLATLATALDDHRRASAALLVAARAAAPGTSFTADTTTMTRLDTPTAYTGSIWARAADADRIDVTRQEHEAFWAWALVEVLRHTGIRFEELRELSHHSITQYRLPSTGEMVPLLQIAPSKTGVERVLLVGPELADVLSAIVSRVRDHTGAIASVAGYDGHEKVWNPPMPLLFQWPFSGEHRPISDGTLRGLLQNAVARTGIRSHDGLPLVFTPHDFRRMFVTDAIASGLPPHIAQMICGHRNITTTMGYKAIYPTESIDAHRAFIARRRAARPSEEYRTPTDQEWDEFLAHFEKRKLSIGTCARAFGTPCIHEHACIRCPMLRPDQGQHARLQDIHDNLLARIAEAEREGWLGEIEGLQISLAGAKAKISQLAPRQAHTDLGMPRVATPSDRNSVLPQPTTHANPSRS